MKKQMFEEEEEEDQFYQKQSNKLAGTSYEGGFGG